MDKKDIAVNAAKVLGFTLNKDALIPIQNEQYDADMPDNWDEMSEEDQAAWKEKHAMKNEQPPEATKANKANAKPKEEQPKPAAPDGNLIWLNSLIDEMGGQEAFKGLLLGAVNAVETMQANEQAERDTLVATLMQNSGDSLTEDELKELDTPVLQKMVRVMVPAQFMDYRPLGAINANSEKGEEMAPLIDIYDPATWKEV